jgi:hypothetical protein
VRLELGARWNQSDSFLLPAPSDLRLSTEELDQLKLIFPYQKQEDHLKRHHPDEISDHRQFNEKIETSSKKLVSRKVHRINLVGLSSGEKKQIDCPCFRINRKYWTFLMGSGP